MISKIITIFKDNAVFEDLAKAFTFLFKLLYYRRIQDSDCLFLFFAKIIALLMFLKDSKKKVKDSKKKVKDSKKKVKKS